MLTIITACSRKNNLKRVSESINFDLTDSWIIVYDSFKVGDSELLFVNNPNIKEYYHDTSGSRYGNSQKNFGLELVHTGFVYFLDDDNIMHPNFWKILSSLDQEYYTHLIN